MPIVIEDGLAPGFLVASPDLRDSQFARTVILLVESSEHGAMGFVVNRRLPIPLVALEDSLDVDIPDPVGGMGLYWGGPVRRERGWLLAHHRDVAEFMTGEPIAAMSDGLYVIADLRTLQLFLTRGDSREFRLLLGYAGWDAAQLEDEMAAGSWLPVSYDAALLRESGDDMWMAALERIGINPAFYFSSGDGTPNA